MKHNYRFLVFAGLLLTAFTAFGQGYQVNGRVTDSFTNEALAGINVIVKGTSTGTITDIDGYYNVQVPDGSTALVFSFIGFITFMLWPIQDLARVFSGMQQSIAAAPGKHSVKGIFFCDYNSCACTILFS